MPGNRFTKMNKKKVAKPSTSTTSSQQKTLFQTWGSKMSSGPSVSSTKTSETDNSTEQFQPGPDCNDNNAMDSEDEDEILMQALEQTTNLSREIGTTAFELQDDVEEIDLSSIPDLPGFDKSAGLKWIYPTNYSLRAYQFDIVKSALFQNTLVALPTGLGKTFIAAVLMFNFYRWYPLGKIVFMAPTKPLVTQQIEACYNIMGIPQSDIAEMTGKMFPVARQKAWKEKRVIFLTPQVLTNDLSRGTCQAEKIKCLVVDEAHKALGNYAYCQVVRELMKINRDFRILALSATPGTNIKMVQEVISNLLISHIELRTDDSPEIKIYSFERKVEKIVCPLGEELSSVETQYLELLESIVNRLVRQKVCYKRNVKSLSKFLILKCRDEFRQNPPTHLQQSQMGVIEGDFALAMSLYHGYELLQLHGLRSFYQYLLSLVNGDKGYGRTRSELMKNVNFMNVYDYLNNKFGEKPSITFTQQTSQEKAENYVIGHPKLEKLREIVLEHFRKFQKEDGSPDTRIMIFSQYRNSVSDITEMLKREQPLVKVISFMGQAVKKDAKCFTQKEQLKVMKEFRDGNFNTLVSTCVGEEGLDIGDVDLIICFDASKSPIRLVQRMGRTGRKRDGRIVMLVTEGKEDQIYKQSQYNKNSITKALQNGTKSLRYYQQSPRMIPDGLEPQCHKMYITIKNEFETVEKAKAKKKEEKKENKTKNAKAKTKAKTKTKKITDLLLEEHSMNGRLTPVSNSNSPISVTEFQPFDENLDLLTRLNMGDNIGSPDTPTYTLMSDDDLPDLSPPRNVSGPKKAQCDTNSKEKSNPRTTKKKSAQKENPKRKKASKKKEEPRIEPFIIIPDNDSASDFVEEPESACNVPTLNDNGGIKALFKSQVMRSDPEPLNPPKSANSPESQKSSKSANSSESQKSSLSKNIPVNKCLVPVAPSLENISELLDDLEAQGSPRHSPDLSRLLVEWDKVFNDSLIKQLDVLSSSARERKEAACSVTLASSSVAQNNNKEFSQLSPEREDIDLSDKDGSESPDLVVTMITVGSPQQTSRLSNIFSPDSSNANNSSHRKRKLSSEAVDSSKLRKHQRLKSPEVETNEKVQSIPFRDDYQRTTKASKSFTEPVKDNSKLVTSYGDLFTDMSLSFDNDAEVVDKNGSLLEKTEDRLPEAEKQKLEISVLQDSSFSLLENTDDRLPEPNKQKLDISVRQDSSFSLLENTDDRLPEPNKQKLDISVRQDSSFSLLENTDDKLPDPEKQKLEISVLQDNDFEEGVPSEDDHLVFDLTTDMFSEDDLIDNIGAKSDSVQTPERDPSRRVDLSSSTPALCKRDSASTLSSLIVSFVNTKFSTSVEKDDSNKDDDDIPLFDLGIDFDAIPPTPVHGKPRSLSSKTSQSNLGCSTPISVQNKAISPTIRDEDFSSSLEDDDELGGFRLVLPALNVIGPLQSQSTPFSKKKSPSEELFSSCLNSTKNNTSPLQENKDEFPPSQGFDLQFDDFLDDDDLNGCEVSVHPRGNETAQRSAGSKEIPIEIDDIMCESSDDSFVVQKIRKKRVMLDSPSSPLHQTTKSTSFTNSNETMDDEDDSFCIRKKKKTVVLTSPMISSQNEGQKLNPRSKLPPSPKPQHKRIRFMVEQERNSQDDFVEADQSIRKLPSTKNTKSGDKNRKLRQKSHHLANQRGALDGRHFLDEEADFSSSDDDHLDENVEEEGDHYEQSFINDFSQMDQTQHMVDMKAVYLQSVVSPVANPRGYKMKYGNANVSNLYSCPPESDDDYQQDSFCVDSEEEESSLAETTVIEDSLLERGPPKNKKCMEKQSTKRRVIRPESSSEEEIFPIPNANVSDCDKVPSLELGSNVKRNEEKSKPVVTENKNCDKSEPLVIFADSREITGAQDIISDLRILHKVNVVVTKLESCDYVVSLRTAVERKVMSDFANGANNKKLVKRLQDMCDYFERPCLIVEKNPLKGLDKKNVPRPISHTKYLETLLSQLSLSPIRLLFSDSKLETCALLASLCSQENVKGMAICRNQVLSDPEQQKLKFFLTLPKVNHALALNLCRNYKNIKDFLQSSVSLIVSRSKMSSERALYLHKFIRQQFR